jgi:hypothetical protein
MKGRIDVVDGGEKSDKRLNQVVEIAPMRATRETTMMKMRRMRR